MRRGEGRSQRRQSMICFRQTTGFLLLLPLFIATDLVTGEGAGPQKPIWIDVRTAGEFEAAHIEGVINIPHSIIGEKIESVTKDRKATIYLHCRSGGRAGVALNTLKKMGYTNVVNIGGFEDAKKKWAQKK